MEKKPNDIMKHFEYGHLPPALAGTSKFVGDLAKLMDDILPNCAEKSAGLRKLLEAKDCFVRAAKEAPDVADPPTCSAPGDNRGPDL